MAISMFMNSENEKGEVVFMLRDHHEKKNLT